MGQFFLEVPEDAMASRCFFFFFNLVSTLRAQRGRGAGEEKREKREQKKKKRVLEPPLVGKINDEKALNLAREIN